MSDGEGMLSNYILSAPVEVQRAYARLLAQRDELRMAAHYGVTYSTGEPWTVTRSRVGDGYVIHLQIGNALVVLPALEAHKLGSALHAASGLNPREADDEVLRSIGVDGLVELVGVLRRDVRVQTDAADAAAEAVGAMADKLSATIGPGGAVAKTMEYLGQVEAERDRLRAVVDAVRAFIAAQVTEGHPPEEDYAAWMTMIAALEQVDVSPNADGDQP